MLSHNQYASLCRILKTLLVLCCLLLCLSALFFFCGARAVTAAVAHVITSAGAVLLGQRGLTGAEVLR